MTKTFQVIRTHLSPYHAPNFQEIERAGLEMLPGIQYKKIADARPGIPTILVTNTHTSLSKIPRELLATTELILHPNSGYDHFRDEEELWSHIPVIIGHEIRAQAVAEYILSSLFQGLTDLPQHLSWDHQRRWDRPLIKGSDVWIFGYGHIGKIVAGTLATLGAQVTVVDPFIKECQFKHLRNWQDGNLKSARIVIAACGLNNSSRLIFNQAFFNATHHSLIFINAARGGLVHEQSLKEFLLTHPHAQAFLDVFESEPFSEEWHHFPQVWKTSHIAGVHKDLDQSILNFEIKVLGDFLDLSREDFLSKYFQEILQNKRHQGVII